MVTSVVSIDAEPALIIIPPLVQPPEFQREVSRQRTIIADNPVLFNGEILFVTSFNGEQLSVYPARFSEKLALNHVKGVGFGALSVLLVLVDQDGRSGWQLRSEHVHYGGFHDFSASGGVTIPDIRGSLYKELAEEIALTPEDLVGLTPVALVPFKDSLAVAYTASLREGAVPAPAAEEVAEFVWSNNPLEELRLLPVYRELWPLIERSIVDLTRQQSRRSGQASLTG